MRLEREKWETDLERGSEQQTVPRPPGRATPLWQRVVQRQDGGRARADSGGGAAG